MEIKLWNSLTNQLETFKPIKENEVSMYVCGPTVYDYVHVGNLRPVVVFDVLHRFLQYIGYAYSLCKWFLRYVYRLLFSEN